jgi:hypothetical protein
MNTGTTAEVVAGRKASGQVESPLPAGRDELGRSPRAPVQVRALPAQAVALGRTANAIERLHEDSRGGSRRSACCPVPRPPPSCSGRCWVRSDHHAPGRRLADPRTPTLSSPRDANHYAFPSPATELPPPSRHDQLVAAILLAMFSHVFSGATHRRVSRVPALTASIMPATQDLHGLRLAEDDRLAPAP